MIYKKANSKKAKVRPLPAIALNENRLNSPTKRQRWQKGLKNKIQLYTVCAPLSSPMFCIANCSALVSILLIQEVLLPLTVSPSQGCVWETQGSELGKPSLRAHFFFLYVQSHESCFFVV